MPATSQQQPIGETIFVSVLFVLIGWWWGHSWFRNKGGNAVLCRLASRLGWSQQLHRDGGKTWIEGRVHDCAAQLKQVNIQSKAANWFYAEASIITPPHNYTFTLRRLKLGTRMLEALGDVYVKTNDAKFDDAWHIESNQPKLTQSWLTSDVRVKLMDLVERGFAGFIQQGNGRLFYRENGGVNNPAFANRMTEVLEVLPWLDDALRVVLDKMPIVSPPTSESAESPAREDWGQASSGYNGSP